MKGRRGGQHDNLGIRIQPLASARAHAGGSRGSGVSSVSRRSRGSSHREAHLRTVSVGDRTTLLKDIAHDFSLSRRRVHIGDAKDLRVGRRGNVQLDWRNR